MKNKELIWSWLEFFVIIVLICVRICIGPEMQWWINIVNYSGLFVALWALFVRLRCVFHGKKQTDYITGLFAVILGIALLLGVLFFTETIPFSTKTNDIILLFTLLFSLPTQLYEHLFVSFLK